MGGSSVACAGLAEKGGGRGKDAEADCEAKDEEGDLRAEELECDAEAEDRQ